MSLKGLRLPAVMEKTGMSRAAIYKLMREHLFPQNIKLSERTVIWLESDIDNWLESKIKKP